MRKRRVLFWAIGAASIASVTYFGVNVVNVHNAAAQDAGRVGRTMDASAAPGKAVPPPSATPLLPGEVSYPSVGISMLPAPAGVQPRYSQAAAVADFQGQPAVANQFAGDIASLQPDIQLMTVTDTQPTDGTSGSQEFLGWVITYSGVRPVFYGGIGSARPPNAAEMNCVLVGIKNAQTGHWAATFESCT
jgi:hypothetical protein